MLIAYPAPVSWDVIILRFPDVDHIREIPDGFRPEPLGARDDVIAAVLAAAPQVDFSDPSWGSLSGAGFSIELGTGEKDVVESVMLFIRGGGDELLPAVHTIVAAIGGRAWDCSSGQFLDRSDATEGLARWQAYRDQVIGDG
jgi:hypothetical protein